MSEAVESILTPLDVEVEFRIPRASQKKGRARGSFAPFFRVGRRVYYRRAIFLAWIADQEQQQGDVAVDDLKSLFPNLGEEARQVAQELVDRAPALSRTQLDSIRAVIVEGGDRR